MRRWWPYAISVAVVVAILAPAVLPARFDSFPLSSYPMYARDRPSTTELPTAVARGPGGERDRLSLDVIANVDDPLIASARLRDAIAAGGDTLDELCRAIARRAGISPGWHIEIVSETHDLVRYVQTPSEPDAIVVHTTCGVAP